MAATATFRFPPDYVLRPAGAIATDALLARQWTKADPEHCHIDPSFWLEQGVERDSYLLLDGKGALFFWKGIIYSHRIVADDVEAYRQLEMHIQFPPFSSLDPHENSRLRGRIRNGLVKGMEWLESVIRTINVREIYFDSASPALIFFCTQKLGFKREGSRLFKLLEPGL